MSSPIWASRFGISDHDFADLNLQLAGHDDPLRWVLANGRISSDEYIRWARDHYDLPSVSAAYFAIPVDTIYWEAVKQTFLWTPAFLPLAEWQGVMLIGCLEPPNFHFPIHVPHRFVIADVFALETRFRELEPKVRQRPADEVLADSLPDAPDVDMRDPEGLLGDFDGNLENLFVVPEGLHVDDIGRPVPTEPDGLESAPSAVIDMDSLDFSDTSPGASPLTSPVASGTSVHNVTPPPALTSPPSLPSPPILEVVRPHVPVIPPGPPPAAKLDRFAGLDMPPVPVGVRAISISEPVVPLATCATIDSLTSAVVAHVDLSFEHAILFMYEGGVLRPSKWSELLLSVKGDNPDAISLDQPSIFRIASRTSLPYHGYVIASPTNTAFFNAFHRGILPKHVTVMPVMISGHLTAMLMGLSMSDVDYKASLTAMEKIASDFSAQLERLRKKQQAA